MGYYVNPDLDTWGSKEGWLTVFGEEVANPEWPPQEGKVLVCLVDNGPFTAAAICYCEQEFNDFRSTLNDPRLKEWYAVDKVDIVQVCPEVEERLA